MHALTITVSEKVYLYLIFYKWETRGPPVLMIFLLIQNNGNLLYPLHSQTFILWWLITIVYQIWPFLV